MRRRMIEVSIAHDKRLCSLSDFAQLIYLRTLPHTDDYGRFEGDPETFKARVDPLTRKTVERYEETIKEIANAGLWFVYETEKKRRVIQFNQEAFERINKFIIKNRAKTGFHEYPAFSDSYRVICGHMVPYDIKRIKIKNKDKDTASRKTIFPPKALLKD